MKKFPLVALSILSGCMVGPNYQTPESNVCDTWNAENNTVDPNEAPLTEWWTIFDDPLLNKYIEMAKEFNQDVKVAEANILQARALRQVAASSLFPQIGSDINATRTYFSKNGPIFAIGPAAGDPGITTSNATGLDFSPQIPQIQNLFNFLFDASWEIDLFGKTRRSVEAANANIETAIEQKNDTLISVMAEVARNYIELRSFQKQVALIEENIALLEKKAKIIEKQFEYGYVSKLDIETILAALATERSSLPNIQAEVYRSIYTLSLLTGNMPEALVDDLVTAKPLPKAPEKIAVGLRSDLLRRRPDIRRAERQLASATANVAVAVASFFPTFTLSGDIGLQSLKLPTLFNLASKTWAYGGDLNTPIFQGGLLTGNLSASRAIAEAANFTYSQTILRALQETESALIAYNKELKAAAELLIATEKNKELVFLSQERHTKGLISLLSLLDTERQLNAAEQSALSSDTSALLGLISLYKALGGGWQPTELPCQ